MTLADTGANVAALTAARFGALAAKQVDKTDVTAEIWTTASNLHSFDLVIGATGGSGFGFASSAPSGCTVLPNDLNGQLLVSG